MKPLIISVLLTFGTSGTYAQNIRPDHQDLAARIADPELRAMTEKVLQRKNHYYVQEALRNLDKKGENFTLMRVEVTGVMSSDDTGAYDKNLFEAQIKPSFSALENMTAVERAQYKFRRFIDPAHTAELVGDSAEYANAAKGVTTANAIKKLWAYRDAEINELVAHSWGCELVYAAILNGDIRPPKKLIVVGVPDNDRKKWALLAEWTGTEVHWARAENDVVRNAQDRAAQIGLDAGASVDFKAKWDAVCASGKPNNRTCHPHERKSKRVIIEKIGKIPGMLGHARTEYYGVLKDKGVFKESHQQLRSAMIDSYEAETERVRKTALEEAVVEARGLVAEAREQVQIARRDHDERLKNAYAELARRSCESPGSVAQAELDALPKSFGTDAMRTTPPGLDECSGPLYFMLLYGSTADQLRARSEPKNPAPLTRDSTPTQGPPGIPSGPEPIRGRSGGSFATLLPLARDLSVTACGSPDRVAIDPALTIRRSDIDFHPRNDDRLVDEFSRDLGECESRLFRRLVEVIRNGEGPGISVRWVQETAAAYRPAPVYYPPPSGRRCEDYGNIRCPH